MNFLPTLKEDRSACSDVGKKGRGKGFSAEKHQKTSYYIILLFKIIQGSVSTLDDVTTAGHTRVNNKVLGELRVRCFDEKGCPSKMERKIRLSGPWINGLFSGQDSSIGSLQGSPPEQTGPCHTLSCFNTPPASLFELSKNNTGDGENS